MTRTDLNILLPEMALTVLVFGLLIGGKVSRRHNINSLLVLVTAGSFAALALIIMVNGVGSRSVLGDLMTDTPYTRFARITALISAAAVLLMSLGYMRARKILPLEFTPLIVLAVLGLLFALGSAHLLLLYLGVEISGLALYALTALRRDNSRAAEAGLKHLVVGALGSGVLLYGASLVFVATGDWTLSGTTAAHPLLPYGIAMIVLGLASKAFAAPFHMAAPDVYEGAPTPVAAFLATVPVLAGLCLLASVLAGAFEGAKTIWQPMVIFMAALSMFFGAVGLLGRMNIKRFMAYSVVVHVGFALMGLAAGTEAGVQAMLIHAAITVLIHVGVFAFILMMERDGAPVTDLGALDMYAQHSPGRAIALLALLVGLAGLPPLLGFVGRLYPFVAAFEAGLGWLVLVGVLASVVAAAGYLRIACRMYFIDETLDELDRTRRDTLLGFLSVCAAAMLLGIVNLFGLEAVTQEAAGALLR
ncbi:MAG: NADH-quinone oxidoreductase subunit N [Pseudomonadota bacterium]